MKQNKNNPWISIDTTLEDKRLESINYAVKDDGRDEESVVFMDYDLPTSRVMLFDNSDFHYGGQGYDANRAELALKTENRFYNGIIGLGGDFFDNANIVGATNPYGARVSPRDAVEGATYWLKNLMEKGFKFSYVLAGNHGSPVGNRNKITNLGPELDLAGNLGVKYVPYTLVLNLNKVILPDNSKYQQMTVCLKHEVQDVKKFVNFLASKGIYPHVIIREHTHDGNDGIYITERPVYNKDGTLKGYEKHQVVVLTGKSMQNGNTYYGAENLFNYKTNVKGLDISWMVNPDYNTSDVTKPKYVARVNPFDVLHKNENKPGAFCEMLLHYYEKPDTERYRENIKDKPFGEIASTLDAINKITDRKFDGAKNFEKNKKLSKENGYVKQ